MFSNVIALFLQHHVVSVLPLSAHLYPLTVGSDVLHVSISTKNMLMCDPVNKSGDVENSDKNVDNTRGECVTPSAANKKGKFLMKCFKKHDALNKTSPTSQTLSPKSYFPKPLKCKHKYNI